MVTRADNPPNALQRGFVMYSEEAGVYLGSCMGLGFWSKWDPVGQDMAVVFLTPEAAEQFVASVDDPANFPENRLIPVTADHRDGDAYYASIAACLAAGLPDWDPNAPSIEDPPS